MNAAIREFLNKQKYLLIIIALNALMFSTCILPVIINTRMIPTDTYRDIAYARSVLNGNPFWADPTIKGEYIWYPPLNPLLFALLSVITSIDLYNLYAFSPVFISFFIPIVFYFFLARLFDKKTAFLSVLLIPIMPWVITHIYTRPIPSWHTFVIIIPVLTYFIRSQQKGFTCKSALILGIAMGLSFNHHSLSTMLIYGAIFLFMFIHHFIFKKKYRWQHWLIVLGVPLLLWSPYLLLNLFRPRLNPEPLQFFADEILDPQFALFIPNQYLFVITIVIFIAGFLYSLRKLQSDTNIMLLYCIIIITIGGQLLGYLHRLSETVPAVFGIFKNLPYLIPHEFQWLFQFFTIPLVAYGFIRFFEIYCLTGWKRIIGIAALILFLFQPYLMIGKNSTKMFDHMAWNRNVEPVMTKWISKNTPVDSVILTTDTRWSFFFIQPYTGRRVVAQFNGHTNYNIDNHKRISDMEEMTRRADINTFRRLAAEYQVDYTLILQSDIPPERFQFFQDNFPVAFTDLSFPFGMATLFKINDNL